MSPPPKPPPPPPPPKPPIWLDNNVLANMDHGRMPHGEAEILNLQADGHQVLITKTVEREFLYGVGVRPEDAVRRQAILNRLNITVDMMPSQVPMEQVRAWRDAAMNNLSIPDAEITAQVRASAQVRGIRNPILLTRDINALPGMRQNGILAVEFRAPLKTQIPPPPPPPSPPPAPKPPPPKAPSASFSAIKTGLKAGLKDAFSAASLAANIAAEIPFVILHFADKAALRAAIEAIEIKFIKEGFAKGVAAGVMRWTEDEVKQNLRYRVTNFRVDGMGDAAGHLKLSQMLKLAQAYEDYAVDIGYQFSSSKPPDWKNDLQKKGFLRLKERGYHFGDNPQALFEYDFIDKLAFVLRPDTNAIVGPAIKFK